MNVLWARLKVEKFCKKVCPHFIESPRAENPYPWICHDCQTFRESFLREIGWFGIEPNLAAGKPESGGVTEPSRVEKEISSNVEKLAKEFINSNRRAAKVCGEVSSEIYISLQEAIKLLGEEDNVEVLMKNGNIYLKKK